MDEKKFVEILDFNNKKIAEMIDHKVQTSIEANNEKLVELMDEKIQTSIEANNEKLVELMDEKIQTSIEVNNEKLVVMMDDKIKDNSDKLIKQFNLRFNQLEQKIIDNNFYFEENYGKKIDIIFEKLQLIDQRDNAKSQELEEYKNNNDSILISHDVRITNLEKAVYSK